MKTPGEIGNVYDFIADWHLEAIGEYPDITAAFYAGDYSKSLEQAQKDKKSWILYGLGFKKGERVLDVGCGWGGMLSEIERRGGSGLGLTVSKRQADYCADKGLRIQLNDWNEVDREKLGKYDHVISIGAFEHFCSSEEYRAGQQKWIYSDFFEFCNGVMKENGRLFLQTMIWGPEADISLDFTKKGKKGSVQRMLSTVLGLSSWWPPESKEQIVNAAKPYFDFIESVNGRRDYFYTFKDWFDRYKETEKGNWKLKRNLAKLYLTNKDFRKVYGFWKESYEEKYFQNAFDKWLLDHERMFFEKRSE
jgi:cyclopropane-fatty-acyl-phospholipid synthase